MTEDAVELRFQHGQASAARIQEAVDEVLVDLADPRSRAAELARDARLDPDALAKATVSVEEEGQGFDPLTTTILLTIATDVGAHLIKQFWDAVIWPRIRARLGVDALGGRR